MKSLTYARQIEQPPQISERRRSLNPFRTRIVKRQLIQRYCAGELSRQAVDTVFRIFPELKDA